MAFWTCVSLTGVKLWLVGAQTVTAVVPARADDALFIRNALSILDGRWLGPLTDVTLAKGPGYPLWLALNHLAGIRLLLSQATLYAIACGVLVLALQPVVREPWRRAVLYAALLFNPATWADGPATRVIREGIYPALAMLVMALAIGTVLRVRARRRTVFVWSMFWGTLGAIVAVTREEGVWMAPSQLILVAYGVWLAGSDGWRRILLAAGTAVAAYVGPVAIVSAINWKAYGTFETSDMQGSDFASAYGALARVKSDRWHPYVPIPREARTRLYAASPTLAEIAAVLEESTAGWAVYGCDTLGVCDDIPGGWMPWALREAAGKVGVYRTGSEAREWYGRVAREVDGACRDGRLECNVARATLMPPWRSEYAGPTARAFLRAAKLTISLDRISPVSSGSRADRDAVAVVEWLTNEKIPEPVLLVEGIATTSAGKVHAAVFDARGNKVPANINLSTLPSAPGLAGEGDSAYSLKLETPCSMGCVLALFTQDHRAVVVPLTEGGTAARGDGITWRSDQFARRIVGVEGSSPKGRVQALGFITGVYALALGPLLVLASALYVRRGLRAWRARTCGAIEVVATALATAVVVRFLLVALVDATSFPAVEVAYLSPVYPFLIGFVGLLLLADDRGPTRVDNA